MKKGCEFPPRAEGPKRINKPEGRKVRSSPHFPGATSGREAGSAPLAPKNLSSGNFPARPGFQVLRRARGGCASEHLGSYLLLRRCWGLRPAKPMRPSGPPTSPWRKGFNGGQVFGALGRKQLGPKGRKCSRAILPQLTSSKEFGRHTSLQEREEGGRGKGRESWAEVGGGGACHSLPRPLALYPSPAGAFRGQRPQPLGALPDFQRLELQPAKSLWPHSQSPPQSEVFWLWLPPLIPGGSARGPSLPVCLAGPSALLVWPPLEGCLHAESGSRLPSHHLVLTFQNTNHIFPCFEILSVCPPG